MRDKLAVVLDYVEDEKALHPLTQNRPIASLPFNGRYRLIDFPLSSMWAADLFSAAVFIGKSGHSIYDHIRNGSDWGLDSSIGGGVFTHSRINLQREFLDRDDSSFSYYTDHRSYLKKSTAKYVLVSGGRVLAQIDLDDFLARHKAHDYPVTAGYHSFDHWVPNIETNLSKLIITDDFVDDIIFVNQENSAAPISLQMAIVDKSFMLEFIDMAEEKDQIVSADNIIAYALEREKKVGSFKVSGYVKVIETIEEYYDANIDMLNEDDFNSLMRSEYEIVTRPHHGAPTYYGPDCSVTNSNVGTGSVIYGVVDHSVIFRKVMVAPSATIKHAVIMNSATIGENVLLEYCILDKDVTIADGVTIKGKPDELIVIKKNEVITQDIIA